MKYLHCIEPGVIEDMDIPDQSCPEDGILVQTVMTGVCRSDIANFMGLEPMPYNGELGKWGHEGLGCVVDIGPKFKSDRNEKIQVGSFVATWSDPAYADFYPALPNEFVVIPEASPKFILQPVACAINIYLQTKKFMERMGLEGEILLLGSGFMATIIGEVAVAEGQDITVVGRANAEIWDDLGVPRYDSVGFLRDVTNRKFKIIIDISSKAENFHLIHSTLAEHEALIAYAGTPTEEVSTNFFENCWACHTFIMPSPRNSDFNDAMAKARDLIIEGKLNTGRLWSKGYNRETQFIEAFQDGAHRPHGYLRGYLKWPG